ncbi:UNVERIFIED_CONTAM: cytochrome [Sesamum calycinum]|uniref:Cytochrome n=1 Tax=Sesamum calycinum TaxID=2727403 RepID=A0AAW2MAM3_9LAMI
MDLDFSSFSILASFFILLITLLRAASQSRTKLKPAPKFPPGPRKLPLIGNLYLFAGFRPPHRTISDLALKYGPVMHLKLGEVDTVVVSSAEAAKQVMKTHDLNFAYRPSLLVTEILCYGNTDIAFAPYGDYWRQLRKICTLELLSVKRVQSFRHIREEEFLNLCRWIGSQSGLLINLTERVNLTTSDVVARASLGKKTEEKAAFISVIRKGIEMAAGLHVADVYPSIKLFTQVSGMRARVERLHKETDRILEDIINDHRAANAATNSNESNKHDDLIDVLLKFHDSGDELHLTIDNLKSVVQDMFSAGSETSSTAVDWAMAEMLKHQRILKKAQDEVRQVFDKKGCVDEDYIHELKYLKCVIKESLRMHPPIPLLLPRECHRQCEIDGYEIPAKTRVMVNAWALGRDPKYWKEAESFKPERYLDINSVDYKGNNFEFIPFGAGRRMCPGISFGLANVELPLAMLLYHFDWLLPEGMKPEKVDMTETFGITARRINPLYVIPVIKRPLPAT